MTVILSSVYFILWKTLITSWAMFRLSNYFKIVHAFDLYFFIIYCLMHELVKTESLIVIFMLIVKAKSTVSRYCLFILVRMYCWQTHSFKTCLLGRGFKFIRNSLSKPGGISPFTPYGGSNILASTPPRVWLWYHFVKFKPTASRYCPLHITINLTILKRVY